MRLSFDARARAILRRLPVVNIYSVAELALLAALAVQCARLLWAMVTPIAPLGAWQPLPPSVPADPAALFASFDPFSRGAGNAAVPAVPANATVFVLFGTRLDVASGGGSAILAGPDGVQNSYAVGEEIAPGVALKAVTFDSATIDRGGASETLSLDAGAGGASSTPPAPTGDATATPAAAAPAAPITAAQLRADTGIVPRIEGGRVSGLTVRAQGSGTAFRAAGLQDGDVVTAIAGQPVGGAGDLERLGQASGPVPVTVTRGGQPVTLNVQVAK